MTGNPSIPFPLERLLSVLGSRGITVDTRQRIAVQRVLADLGGWAHLPSRELARYVAPVLVKGPEEQATFYAVWEELFPAEVSAAEREELFAAPLDARPSFFSNAIKWLRRWWWALLIPLVSVIGFVAWVELWPLEVPEVQWHYRIGRGEWQDWPVDSTVLTLSSQDTISLYPSAVGGARDVSWSRAIGLPVGHDTIQESFEKEGTFSLPLGVHRKRLWRTESREEARDFDVRCKGRPTATPYYDPQKDLVVAFHLFDHSPEKLTRLKAHWQFDDGAESNELAPVHRYEKSGKYTVVVSLADTEFPDCERLERLPVDLTENAVVPDPPDTNTSARLPDLPPLPAMDAAYAIRVRWDRILYFSLVWLVVTGLGLWLLRIYLRRKEARKMAERQARFRLSKEGPYNIPWPNQDHLIAWDEHLDRVAAVMAGRGVGERLHLDMPASIRATAHAAKQPSLRFRGQGEPLTWLFLVDEGSLSPFELRMVDWWLRRLHSETVILDAYHYRDSPEQVWRNGKPGAFSIQQLQGMHGRAHLVVVSRGDGLLSPFRGVLRSWAEEAFRPWKRRTLLTPENALEWAGRERALSKVFGICPMESRLMLQYFLLPDVPMAEDHRAWQRELLRHRAELQSAELPRRVDRKGLWEALGDTHLSRWILGIHAYPEQIWEHVVATGARLKGEGRRLPWDDVWQLLRMPFLKENAPIRKLQKEAQELTTDADVRTGREVAIDLLTEAQGILRARGHAAGMAHTEIERERAMQAYQLAPDGLEERANMDALRAEGVDVQAALHKIKFPKWPFAMPVLVLGLMLGIGFFLLPDRETAAPDKEMNVVGDWLTDWDTVGALVDSVQLKFIEFHHAYDRGRQLFDQKEYGTALRILDSTQMEMSTYVTLVEDQGRVDSFKYGLLTCFFQNGIGLSRCYQKEFDDALKNYVYIFQNSPNFFQDHASKLPNLPSLLRVAGALQHVEGTVRDDSGKPLVGATVQISSDGLGLKNFLSDSTGHFALDYLRNDGDKGNELNASLLGYGGVVVILKGEKVKDLVLKRNRCANPKTLDVRVISPDGKEIAVTGIGGLPGAMEWKATAKGAQLSVCGDMPARIKLWVEAGGYERLDTTINSGSRVILTLRLRSAGGFVPTVQDPNPVGQQGYLELDVTGVSGLQINEFEVSADGVQLRKATSADRGVVRIPVTELNGSKGRIKVSTLGYADKEFETNWATSVQVKMDLHPELQKLLSSFVSVKGGKFTMGCTPAQEKFCANDERPAHEVELSDFAIGNAEVTQIQYRVLMGADPDNLGTKGCDQCPVNFVTRSECERFILALSELTGREYALPTEAQWEYAARGGANWSDMMYAGSEDMSKVGWYSGNSGGKVHAVRTKVANGLGLYDMSGNAQEWCLDSYAANTYATATARNPLNYFDENNGYVLRGGDASSPMENCRVARRAYGTDDRSNFAGFRLVKK